MAALAEPGAAEEPTSRLGSLPDDLLRSILGRVSELSRGYSHALVCRRWAALAPSSQLSCSFSSGEVGNAAGRQRRGGKSGKEQRGCKDLTQISQELSLFPSLTSLDITATTRLPESFLSSISRSLQHLQVHGNKYSMSKWTSDERLVPAPEGLARFQIHHTDMFEEYEWTLEALLQVCVGGITPCMLQSVPELTGLRVLRASLPGHELSLPESMSRLTNLEDLTLIGESLNSLFSGIGNCRKLRRLVLYTKGRLVLPPSFTQLSCLSYMFLTAQTGVLAPLGMEALTSLRTIRMGYTAYTTTESEADALFAVPSLKRLFSTGLGTDMRMLTSLQELIHHGASRCYPESMWALGNLRVLRLFDSWIEEIPESVSGLSRLEELEIARCDNVTDLPNSVARLPHLRKVSLEELCCLHYLPPFQGAWPSLQVLHLKDLPELTISACNLKVLVSKVEDLQISECPGIIESDSQF